MASIAEIRKQYPQYSDLSDQQLSDALYQTHYHDMPRDQFDAAIGAKARPTSQALGFVEGVRKPLDNAALALDTGLRRIGVPTDQLSHAIGQPGVREANATAQTAMRTAESTQKPGTVGKIAGEVVGTAPIALVTKNPFAVNAASGAALSDSKSPFGVAADAAGSAVLGHFVGKAADAAADFIKPAIDPAVRMLSDAGVKLTPGMVKGGKAMVREDKAMSRPGIGGKIAADRQATQETFNTATVNRALEPLGVKVPAALQPGHDAVSFAHDAVSQAYDQVVPNLSVNLNTRTLAAKLAGPAASLPKPQQQQLQAILTNTIGKGSLTGQALKDAQGELRRLASTYGTDASAPNRELGRILRQADDHLTQDMLGQNPIWAPALQRVNTAFRGLRTVEDAASRADNGVINTGQLKQAVRRADKSVGKNASARGDAFMQDWSNAARDVIPARTADSGTAGRLNAGNLFANLGGRVEGLGYSADNIFQQARLAPRPAAAEPVAQAVKRLKGPLTAGAIAAAHQPRN